MNKKKEKVEKKPEVKKVETKKISSFTKKKRVKKNLFRRMDVWKT